MPQVSVIVPVYNTENYLKECLNSILCQTFSDFELILVDDGSTDNSGTICDEYAEKDLRVRSFHSQNNGVSSARNIGLDHAKGSSIIFVDADDLIDKDYIEKLTSVSSDLVLSNFDDYWPRTGKRKEYPAKDGEFTIDNEQDIILYLTNGYAPGFVWGKLFSIEIIKNNRIQFDEKQKHSEDVLFIGEYIKCIKRIVKLNYCGYHHCQYDTNTLSSAAMKEPLINRMDWWEKAISQFEGYPTVQKYYSRLFLSIFEHEGFMIVSSDDSYSTKFNSMKKMLKYDSLKKCVEITPNIFPKPVNYLIKYGISELLILFFLSVIEKTGE